MKVYLDNAASTPMDSEVVDVMIPWLRDHYGNPSSVHSHGRTLRNAIEKSRKTIALALGAAPSEIIFMSGGTEADNTAIRGAVEGLGLKHIISSPIEHHAVTHCVEELEKKGIVSVTWLPVDKEGRPDFSALEAALEKNPKSLVTLMHANNELGTITDIQKVGELCSSAGAIFHSDTVQTIGNLRYNLASIPIQMITGSAHKFYGPKGIGFLYLKSGVMIPPFILGGSQERNMRAGTENVAGIVGMAFAMEKCYKILDSKNTKLSSLKEYFKKGLEREIAGIEFNGDTTTSGSIPTVLNASFPTHDEENMILFNLDIAGVSASGGSACTSGSLKGSHVLNGIGASPLKAVNSVRFSFGIQNTIEELDFALAKVSEFVKAAV